MKPKLALPERCSCDDSEALADLLQQACDFEAATRPCRPACDCLYCEARRLLAARNKDTK